MRHNEQDIIMSRSMAKNLKAFRAKTGQTQRQFAENCGISVSTVKTIEKGCSNPKVSTLGLISLYTGMSPEELMGVEEQKPQTN